MSNITIPLVSHINTKDDFIIHEIDSQDKDVLNKKNTLSYKSVLSPMWTKSENKIYTTTGNTLSVTNSSITDKNGVTISVDNSLVVDKTLDISRLWNGTCIQAFYDNDYVYSSWTNGSEAALLKSDLDNNIITKLVYNDSSVLYNRAIWIDAENYITARILTSGWSVRIVQGDSVIYQGARSETVGKDLYTYKFDNNTYFIGFDDTDLRKRYLFKITLGDPITWLAFRGFGCIGSNGLVTGEPIPIDVSWSGGATSYLVSKTNIPTIVNNNAAPWNKTAVLENGVIAFEMYNGNNTVEEWIASNEALKADSGYTGNNSMVWGSVDHTHAPWRIASGLDISTGNFIPLFVDNGIKGDVNTPEYDARDFNFDDGYYVDPMVSTSIIQVDLSDGLGNLTWEYGSQATIENGCNPFPQRYFITNRASSKGVYWDYGPGWSRSYVRKVFFDSDGTNQIMNERNSLSIVSYGLANTKNKIGVRVEPLSIRKVNTELQTYDLNENYSSFYAQFFAGSYFMRAHVFNPTIFDNGMVFVDTVGADNLPNNSVLLRIPFNVMLQNNSNILDQYFQGNYLSTSVNGTLILSASAQTNLPSFVKGNSIFSNGQLVILKENGDVKVTKVADYIYRTNTVNGINLIIDSTDKLVGQRGFIAYNDDEWITLSELSKFSLPKDNDTSNDTYYSAAGYNVNLTDMNNRAVSYLLPAFQLPLSINSEEVEDFSFQLLENKKSITKPYIQHFFSWKDNAVDHFYTHSLSTTSVKYQNSRKLEPSTNEVDKIRFGVATYDVDKADQVWWITSSIQIFPMGIASLVTGINYLSSNIDQADDYTVRLYRTNNSTFPVFNPNNAVYKGSTIFTIYGYNYSFDGQSIYYLGSGDDTTQMNFACYALGMKFLANSGTEAYFYSPFEKRIYLFTGSVTLQMSISLAREGNIIDSVYSSLEQILYLMTDTGNVIAKSQEDMCLIENVGTEYHFEATETGMILVGPNGYKRYRLYKTDETEFLPLVYETEYLGKNDSLFKVSVIDLTFFDEEQKEVNAVLSFECVNDKLKINEKIPVSIKPKDWTDTHLTKVRLTPKNNVLKAFKFGLTSSSSDIHLANVCIGLEEVSQNTNAAKHK